MCINPEQMRSLNTQKVTGMNLQCYRETGKPGIDLRYQLGCPQSEGICISRGQEQVYWATELWVSQHCLLYTGKRQVSHRQADFIPEKHCTHWWARQSPHSLQAIPNPKPVILGSYHMIWQLEWGKPTMFPSSSAHKQGQGFRYVMFISWQSFLLVFDSYPCAKGLFSLSFLWATVTGGFLYWIICQVPGIEWDVCLKKGLWDLGAHKKEGVILHGSHLTKTWTNCFLLCEVRSQAAGAFQESSLKRCPWKADSGQTDILQ